MKNYLPLFLTGIGIGIFLGLSNSPILLQILVPILTIIVGLLAILTGQKDFENKDKKETQLEKLKNINAYPIMWMVTGMVVGSILGMLARNYSIFSPKEVRENVIESNEFSDHKTVLHSISIESCKEFKLCQLKGLDLLSELKNVENPEIEEILSQNEINLDSLTNKIKLICQCND